MGKWQLEIVPGLLMMLRVPDMSGNRRKSAGKELVFEGGQYDKNACAGP